MNYPTKTISDKKNTIPESRIEKKAGVADIIIKRPGFLRRNLFNFGLVALFFGFLVYQRLPLYLQASPLVGKKAPDFQLRNQQGKMIRLSDYKGKFLLLNFWATWCGPCLLEMPVLRSLQKELKNQDFEILAISAEDPLTIKNFLLENPANYQVFIDTTGQVFNAYKISIFPTFYFINRAGIIIDFSHGLNLLLKWKVRWWVTGSPF